MTKDAADDPYKAQLHPFVLPCVDCKEEGLIVALRHVEGGTHDTPLDPLCEECAGIELRVWGKERLSILSPGTRHSISENGVTLYVVLCGRCNGTGRFLGDGYCFACAGARYDLIDPKGVRRTARWWQTYQQNRTKPPD